MIDGNTAFFLLPGNRTNRADVHALRLFALTAGVRGIVEIAIQAAARANPVVAKEIIAMDLIREKNVPTEPSLKLVQEISQRWQPVHRARWVTSTLWVYLSTLLCRYQYLPVCNPKVTVTQGQLLDQQGLFLIYARILIALSQYLIVDDQPGSFISHPLRKHSADNSAA